MIVFLHSQLAKRTNIYTESSQMHGNLRERLERSHSKSFACVRAVTKHLADFYFDVIATRDQLQYGISSVLHVRRRVETRKCGA